MKNVAIVGLGVIAQKYVDVMLESSLIHIRTVCDRKHTSLAKRLSDLGIPYFQDYEAMPLEGVDVVFVLTPVDTHWELGNYFLMKRKHVFLEKPATQDLKSLDNLISRSIKSGIVLDVILHWRYGNEVMFLKNREDLFSDAKRIHMIIDDPYTKDGFVIPSKASLGGAWLDSGINALSFLSLWFDLKAFRLKSSTARYCDKTSLDIHHVRIYEFDKMEIVIEIHWDRGKNHKETLVEKSDSVLRIDHTNQSVYKSNIKVFDGRSEDRLKTHYHNFLKTLQHHTTDHEALLELHKLVFEKQEGDSYEYNKGE